MPLQAKINNKPYFPYEWLFYSINEEISTILKTLGNHHWKLFAISKRLIFRIFFLKDMQENRLNWKNNSIEYDTLKTDQGKTKR